MFVFDLFGINEAQEKPSDKKQGNLTGKSQLYTQTQDPNVRDIIQTAYREFPQAKNDMEALAGHLAKQSDLNAQQETEIEQRKEIENNLRQRQDAMVKDLQDKEKRFQDFTAQVAKMELTPPEQARAAQDVEQGKEPSLPATRTISSVPTASSTARTVTRPAAGAQPLAVPVPISSEPSTDVKKSTGSQKKDKDYSKYDEPAYQRKGIDAPVTKSKDVEPQDMTNVVPVDFGGAGNVRGLLNPNLKKAAESVNEDNIAWDKPKSANVGDIAQANLNNIVLAALAPGRPSLRLYFADGHGPTLPWNQVAALYNYLAKMDRARPDTQSLVTNMLSNSRFFYEFMLNRIVGQTPTDPVPKKQPVPGEPEQGELLEADILPFPTRLQSGPEEAIELANNIIKHSYDPRVPTQQIDIMKQRLFKDYQTRIQQTPDGRYYMMLQGDRVFLSVPPHARPVPPMPSGPDVAEDSWHDGRNAWSSEHDLWAKEDINNEAWLINDPEKGHQIVPDGGFGTWDEKSIVNNLERKFTDLLGKLKGRGYQQIEYALYHHGVIETLIKALAQYEKFMGRQGRRPIGRGREIDMSKNMQESLRPGEYHIATVTLDDGSTVRVPITSDEGWREPIVHHFEKQGKQVKDIQVDYSIHGTQQWNEDDNNDSVDAVKGAITRRIIGAHPDWITRYGVEVVIDAIDDVADFVGDVEEIGSSDVSGWTRQVHQHLKDRADRVDEKKKITAADDPCWKGYHMVGKKKKNGREVPNCVPGQKG